MKRISLFGIIFACLTFLALPGHAAPLDTKLPTDVLVYVGWAGSDSLAPQYAKSNLKGLIEASTIKRFIDTQLPALIQMAAARDPSAPQNIAKLQTGLGIAWHHPVAFYFCPVGMKDPAKPTAHFGFICEAGSDAKALSDLLTEAVSQIPPDPELPVKITTDNTTVSLTFGTPSDPSELITAAPLAKSPNFIKAMAQIKQTNQAIVVYVDAQHLRTMIEDALAKGPDVPPEVKAKAGMVIDALGIKSLTQIAYVGGFDNKSWTERAFVGVSGPRTGLLSLASTTPLSDGLLAAVPQDAAAFSAGKFDLHKLFTQARDIAGKIDPNVLGQLDGAIAMGNAMLSLDIDKDILTPLGDEWLLYRAPLPEGGISVAFVSKLKDGDTFAKSLQVLETLFNEKSGSTIKIEKVAAGKQQVSALMLPLYNVAWTVHNGYLYVSSLSGITAAMGQVDNKLPSIATSDLYKSVMASMPPGIKPISITYAHPARLYPELRAAALGLLPLLRTQGINVPLDIFPDPTAISEFLPPGGMVTWTDADGDHAFSTSAFPGASMLGGQSIGAGGVAVAAMGTAILLPSLGKARELSNRSVSAASLRGIAQSALVSANENQDKLPDHLGRLLIAGDLSPKSLINKRTSTQPLDMTPAMVQLAKDDFAKFAAQVDQHCDYVYLGKGMKSEINANVAVAYEKTGPGITDGINIAFQDAHVEFVRFAMLPQAFRETNDYLAQHNLPRVDVNALMAGQTRGVSTPDQLIVPSPARGRPANPNLP